jgi:hypothetical protein
MDAGPKNRIEGYGMRISRYQSSNVVPEIYFPTPWKLRSDGVLIDALCQEVNLENEKVIQWVIEKVNQS